MSTTTVKSNKQEQQLTNAVSQTIETFKQDISASKATFRVTGTLKEAFKAQLRARDLNFISDEPEELGGKNEGPNPVELLLASLASCQQMVVKTHASQLGLELKSVDVKVEGDIDLRGFFAIDNTKPGFSNIRYKTTIVTDEQDAEKLDELKKRSDENCPILDVLQHPVEVEGHVAIQP